MSDTGVILILAGLIAATLRQPWLGVLGLAVLNLVHPQGWGNDASPPLPLYAILTAATIASALHAYVRRGLRPAVFWDWRFAVLALLLAQFAASTYWAINPWFAWPKLGEVARMFLPLLLIVALIDTREKLFMLMVAIAGSVAAVAVKGGYWALITGFHDRVYGAPGSQMGGNNEFAIGVAMAIPLLLLWWRESGDRAMRILLGLAIALCYGAALSSWSRGALLSLSVMTLLVLWQSRRLALALALAGIGMALALVSLPEAWFARMGGLGQYAGDASAQGRLAVWRIGWEAMLAHPVLGSGFESWIFLSLPTGGSLDWHNAYVEMGVEHGWLGLALWGLLLVGSFVSLSRLATVGRVWRMAWVTRYSAALRASLAAYAVGAFFLGIAYWELLYWLLIGSVLVRRFALQEQRAILNTERLKGGGGQGLKQSAVG